MNINNELVKKDTIEYFMASIFEAKTAYTLWQCIAFSKATNIVGEEMANKYVEIQNYHPQFFITTERTALITFVILILHPFDNDNRSYSLFKINKEKTEKFILENQETYDQLTKVRNKVFAHRDLDVTKDTSSNYPIPSLDKLDKFFSNLIELYNDLSKDIDGSFTVFANASEIKHEVDHLFMNLYRGKTVEESEIDLKYLSYENNLISKKIRE